MQLLPYVERLRATLADSASTSGAEAVAAADLLLVHVDPVARLVLLEALSAATAEISNELAPTAVEVRLRGLDPQFVVVAPEQEPESRQNSAPTAYGAPPAGEGEAGETTRTTLRLPESLKARIEVAASQEGISVNAWMVRALGAALDQGGGQRHPPTGRIGASGRGTSYTGWAH